MDEKRRLERLAARGDTRAEARLRARLSKEWLALAARLGDEASAVACGWSAWCRECWLPHGPEAGVCTKGIVAWTGELGRFGHEAAVRIAVAGVQPAQDAWEVAEAKRLGVSFEGRKANGEVVEIPVTHVKAEALARYGIDARPRRALEALRGWLDDQVEGAKALAGFSETHLVFVDTHAWLQWVMLIAGFPAAGRRSHYEACLERALVEAAKSLGRDGARRVREAVRREVCPWALSRARGDGASC